jgi:hypothetical protein
MYHLEHRKGRYNSSLHSCEYGPWEPLRVNRNVTGEAPVQRFEFFHDAFMSGSRMWAARQVGTTWRVVNEREDANV